LASGAGLWHIAGAGPSSPAGTLTVDGALDKALADAPEIQPISRHSLHGDLVERIRDMIIEGQLRPGARINEGQLGTALGVSRTPLREAIKFIASEGLIELVPGRGAVIKALTPRDVREMLAVLCGLETMAARIGCGLATSIQIAAIERLHEQMMRCYQRDDRLEYYKLNQAIHTGIVQLADNRFLAAQHAAIQARLKRIRFLGNGTPEKWACAVAEHEAMIEALAARDSDRLSAVLIQHMDLTWDRVKDSL
jgi:DNA-binding GntR family transcriptional regulator